MDVHDQELMAKYIEQSPAHVRKFGGRYLVRGSEPTCLEGTSFNSRTVIVEFPNRRSAEQLFSDPSYIEIAKIRQRASTMRTLVIQDGFEFHLPVE